MWLKCPCGKLDARESPPRSLCAAFDGSSTRPRSLPAGKWGRGPRGVPDAVVQHAAGELTYECGLEWRGDFRGLSGVSVSAVTGTVPTQYVDTVLQGGDYADGDVLAYDVLDAKVIGTAARSTVLGAATRSTVSR